MAESSPRGPRGSSIRASAKPELMTVEEFAELTRRSASAVRASILRREIPARKFGRRWFIRMRDVHRLFDEVDDARG